MSIDGQPAEGQPSDPLDDDPEIIAAEKAKRLAEAGKATAEADKARAEAEKAAAETAAAVEAARRTAANADRDASLADAKAKAENDKSIAEARAGAAKAWTREPLTKPVEGTVTVGDGTGTVGRAAAYALLGNAAATIADQVVAAKAMRVLLVDHVDLAASDWCHAIVNSQITRLTAAAQRSRLALTSADVRRGAASAPTRSLAGLGAAATLIPSLVGAVADVAGYFRSDYTVGKVEVTASSTPLVASVAGALTARGITVHVDGLALFDADTGTVGAFGRMLDARWDLLDARLRTTQGLLQRAEDEVIEAQADVDEAKAAATATPGEQQEAAVRTTKAALARAQDEVARAQGLVDAAAKVEELIDNHVTAVTTVAPEQSLPPLAQAALRDLVHDPVRDIHVLALSVDHVGSDASTRRALFRSPTTTYIGAAHVSAVLLAPGGDVAVGATVALTSATHVSLKSGTVTSKPSVPVVTAGAAPSVLARTTPPAPATLVEPLPTTPPRPAAEPATARWTLLVYMAGMNNLAGEADADIAEIVAGQAARNIGAGAEMEAGDIEVVVFVKQPTGARRFRVGGPEERLGDDVDSGDPNTVVDFVRWGTAAAPAERYALILWNHGSGWEPWAYDTDTPVAVRSARRVTGEVRKVNSSLFPTELARRVPEPADRQRAILTDDGTSHAVDTIELGRALTLITEHLGRKLDVLGMDACLMSNLEVASEVRDLVEVVVASEELEPGSGWHYQSLLEGMRAAGDSLTAEQFGQLAVESYIEGYQGTGEAVTLCAVATAGAVELAGAIDGLADALLATLPEGRTLVTDALGDSVRFDGHLVDLGDFCTRLRERSGPAPVESVRTAVGHATAVLDLLAPGRNYIVAEAHLGDALAAVHGVSIYLPARTDPFAPTYVDIRFSREGRWDDFLEAYRDAGRPVAR